MNPQATLNLIDDALDVGDLEAAQDAYEDLMDWLFKGGYHPNGYEVTMHRLNDALR